jgi:rfaE bifunctional protein kinase chain/domain/rfaE bifunctional protein nucleotidyltransferase chain/domain
MKNKFFLIDKLVEKLNLQRRDKVKIGLSHGVFDLLHLGHIKHFKEAKKNCDLLIVSVTADQYVNKGPNRPAFNQYQRIEALEALEVIDYIILSSNPSSTAIIKKIKPDIYFKGPDYKNNLDDLTKKIFLEKNEVEKNGGKIFYTKDEKFSSSSLIKNFIGIFNETQKKELSKIKAKYDLKSIKKIFNKIQNIKPLIIGESIIDEYHFTETLGKSGKEPVLVLKELYNEKYLGGALAVCRHLNSFIKKMYFLSYLGEKKEFKDFINLNLSKNIFSKFIYKKNSPTILKKRFVDKLTNAKTLGVYQLNDEFLNYNESKKLLQYFSNLYKKSDLIIISDYGHGLLNKKFIEIIKKTKKFIAVNVQVNSSNIGYHSLKNFNGVDCMIINENELRYEMRSKNEDIQILMKKLIKEMKLKNLIVTRGSSGVIMITKNYKIFRCQAYAGKIVDKIGAGDAMIAILALLLFTNVDSQLSLFVASLCASQKISFIGNKQSIDKNILLKEIEHLID